MAHSHLIKALYLHLPFCKHLCPFCAFAVVQDAPHKHERYLALLKDELQLMRQQYPLDFAGLYSLYLGGGTPSRLHLAEMEQLFSWLEKEIGFPQGLEISVELNPEDVTLDSLRQLKGFGVTRLSLGIQSFNDYALCLMERQHSVAQNHKAIELAHQVGFSNLNLDFLFGWPGQSFASFEEDLKSFLALSPPHLSAYLLNMEPKTKITKRPYWVNWMDQEEALFEQMYLHACHALEQAGIPQYEVSNFAKPGFESRQNLSNWAGENYLGLGMGAHGLLHPFRMGNHGRFADYQAALTQGHLPHHYQETLDPQQDWLESVMTGLRQREGIPLSKLAHFVYDKKEKFISFLQEQQFARIEENRLKLTPRGLLIADYVTHELNGLPQMARGL